MDARQDRILQEIDRDRILEFTRTIVAIPSPRFQETALARYLVGYLDLLGLETNLMPVAGEGWQTHQAIGRLKGSAPGPRILLNAHLDTGSGQYEGLVYRPEEWTHDPFAGEVENGYLYGLGTHNNKNGVAATVQAVEALVRSGVPLAGEIILGLVALETNGGIGSEALVKAEGPFDYAIVAEGTGQNVVTVSVGNYRACLDIEGEHEHHTPHASPIDAAGSLLARLSPSYASIPPDSWLTFTPDPTFPGYPRAAVRGIQSDLDRCSLYIDIVTLPSQTPDGLLADLQRLAREIESDFPGTKVTVDPSRWIAPYIENNLYGGKETAADSPLVRAISAAHERVLGQRPQVGATGRFGAAADASIFRREGIPTVEYGPGSVARDLKRWPAIDERVRVDDLVSCSSVIALAVAQLCQPQA